MAVARYLEQEKAVRFVLANDRKSSQLILTDDQVKVLEAVIEALEPVSALTDMLSG